jgi:parvulin-like peptidyl-prolyl isomerase
MKLFCRERAAALFLFILPTLLAAESKPERVLLEIGPQKITVNDFLLYLKQINENLEFTKLPEAEQRRLLDEFVAKKLFAARARQIKLDQKPDVHAKLEFFADGVLAQECKANVLNEIIITDEEASEHYRTHKDDYRLPPRVYLQHFLYRSKEKAARTQARLRQGATYAEIAKEKKGDPDFLMVEHSWNEPQTLISQLAGIAFRLPVGQISNVISSSFGFHVLRVEGREPSKFRELSEARADIAKHLRQLKAAERYKHILNEMKHSEQVHLYIDNL